LIYETAALYATARAGFIGWTMGVNHSTKGTDTVCAINNLALITGNVGRAGAAPFSITGQCNAMGTREAGFTSSLRDTESSIVARIGKRSPPVAGAG
jgi:assimilatory nitrate reductase catalytic subunit